MSITILGIAARAAHRDLGAEPGATAATRLRRVGVRGRCRNGDRRLLRFSDRHGSWPAVHHLHHGAVRAGHALPRRGGGVLGVDPAAHAARLRAVLGGTCCPTLFAGQIMVAPQKNDPLQPGFVPLAFSAGNVTQPMYLGMNIVVAVTTALFQTRASIPYRSIMSAYLLGGYIVVALAFWQFASRLSRPAVPRRRALLEPKLGHCRADGRLRSAHPGTIFGTGRPRLLPVGTVLLLSVADRAWPSPDACHLAARARHCWRCCCRPRRREYSALSSACR